MEINVTEPARQRVWDVHGDAVMVVIMGAYPAAKMTADLDVHCSVPPTVGQAVICNAAHHVRHSAAHRVGPDAGAAVLDAVVPAREHAKAAAEGAEIIVPEAAQDAVEVAPEAAQDAAAVVPADAQTAVLAVKGAALGIVTVAAQINVVIRARQIAAAVVPDAVHPVVRDAQVVREVVLDAAEPAVLDAPVAQVPAVLDARLDVGHPVGIAAHQLVLGATVHATALALDAEAVAIHALRIAVHPAVIHVKMSASVRHQHQF